MANPTDPFAGVTWYDGSSLTIHGLAWPDQARALPYDRLPSRYLVDLPENLAADTVLPRGVAIEFQGAPRELFARYTLIGTVPERNQMSALAQSGLDVYGRRPGEAWQYAGSRWPWNLPDCNGRLTTGAHGLDGEFREWRVHLPLCHRVQELQIGSREPLQPLAAPATLPPIVYYGTSIVAGCCVSRPGMPHATQLDRLLDHEVINLGFPGMAMLESAMAKAIADIDAALFILDPIPNNRPEQIIANLPGFIRCLRAAHPDKAILLVQDRYFDNAHCTPAMAHARLDKNQALDTVLAQLQGEGMKHLHLARHPNWFGDDGSVDGSHPNDLGARRMAEALAPLVASLLEAG